MEKWKKIETDKGDYSISNLGRVRNNKPRYKNKIFLSPYITPKGYCAVTLSGRMPLRVHRLVAEAFIENPNNKPFINHIDGNKQNNRVENLEWVTQQENNAHAFRTGLNGGTKHNTSKLTKEEVLFIRNNFKPKDKEFGATALSKRFGINRGGIYKIIKKQNYKLL